MPANEKSFTLAALIHNWCQAHPGHKIEFTDCDPEAHANDKEGLMALARNGPSSLCQQHPFYKTLLCTSFEGGSCPRGALCAFAHGAHELR